MVEAPPFHPLSPPDFFEPSHRVRLWQHYCGSAKHTLYTTFRCDDPHKYRKLEPNNPRVPNPPLKVDFPVATATTSAGTLLFALLP